MPSKKEKKQIINITTTNGKVKVERTDKKAVITQNRSCFGFKENSVTEVTKVTEECMHYAFGDTQSLVEIFKNN